MAAKDWLLFYIVLPTEPNSMPQPLDPIRIMKGMFLFTMEGFPYADDAYKFEPYYYGPCSFAVYADLDALVADDLIAAAAVPGQTWKVYSATKKGRQRAEDFREKVAAELVERLVEIKKKVTALSFLELLREVYSRYPDYARNSVVAVPHQK